MKKRKITDENKNYEEKEKQQREKDEKIRKQRQGK